MPWGELVVLVRRAGEAILPYWRADVAVHSKANESPVAATDLTTHYILEMGLRALVPDIPVLSEEDCEIPPSECGHRRRWWLVDPPDGTKELIPGSKEFTVNVALVEDGQVLFGLVGVPVSGRCYYGGAGLNAWREEADGGVQPISVRLESKEALIVAASKCHGSLAQERLLDGLSECFGNLRRTSIDSSPKFCLLAEGAVDCYPHLTPALQWGTAVAQGVLEGTGGETLDLHGASSTYEPREDHLNGFLLALPRAAE